MIDEYNIDRIRLQCLREIYDKVNQQDIQTLVTTCQEASPYMKLLGNVRTHKTTIYDNRLLQGYRPEEDDQRPQLYHQTMNHSAMRNYGESTNTRI
eukprot:5685332-Amphidinium_carterae.1